MSVTTKKTVLFVSKPLAPPFHDGTKCLVRDVATNLERVSAAAMSSVSAPPLPNVRLEPVYPTSGHFSPGLLDNLRATGWLLARAKADLLHFVFAPNPRASRVCRLVKRLRRLPAVQTVASPPRTFSGVRELLFGDIVVTQSAWTRRQFEQSCEREGLPVGERPRFEVILPPVPELRRRTDAEQAAVRRELGILPAAPLFVYPGDLETSGGARAVARAVSGIVDVVPDAIIVFAYRAKTAAAHGIANELAAGLPRASVRFASELPDVLSLLQGARAVLFPVDDLWGKVDLPIVLLESMFLGIPVVLLDRGPLAELGGVVRVSDDEPSSIVAAVRALSENPELVARVIAEQKSFVGLRNSARSVACAYEDLYLDLLS